MMIFLQILKIIGIVLAVIIGLIIIIILLVLFAPFSYYITGQGENEDIVATVTIKWLGSLLHLDGEIRKGQKFDLKTHFAGLEIKKKENSLISRILKRIGKALWEVFKKEFLGIEPEKYEPIPDDLSEREARKQGFIRKLQIAWDKVKEIWELLKLAKYVIGAPVTARAWKTLKSEFAGLLNRIKPTSMEGEVEFGTGDPDTTAEGYGIAAWIAANMDDRLMIIPDMENKTIRLDVSIKGRIFVRNVLSFVWRILTDRDIRRVVGYIGRNL